MPLSAGEKLGPFEILSLLGAGGMGEVYEARDTRLGRVVALKVSKEQFSERFAREARTVAALSHPNICRLYDVGPNYLVMELVEGETLAARLRKGPLPTDLVLRYGAEIADAVAAAHSKRIVHRDLKPANVMITKAGAKVLDFGLATSASEETLTMSGVVMGTPAYMAPEQREGKTCDARTDIYAIGLMLYEMSTGKRASRVRSQVGQPELEQVIGACLAEDPDDRFQSARDLKRAIDWCRNPAGGPVSSATSPVRWRLAVLAVAVLAAIAGWASWLLKPTVTPPSALRFGIALPPETFYSFGAMSGGSAISPDGKTLAFAVVYQGQSKLMLRALDSFECQLVPGTEGAHTPFWSPDSTNVGFVAAGRLKRVRASGGAPQTITASEGAYGAWHEDGFILTGAMGQPILRVSADGGEPQPLTRLSPSNRGHMHPGFLPGGKYFIYYSPSGEPGKSGIYAGRLDATAEAQEPSFLLNADSQAVFAPAVDGKAGWLVYLRDGALRSRRFDPERLQLSGTETIVDEQVRRINGYDRGDFSVSRNGLLAFGRTGYALTSLQWLTRDGLPLDTVSEPAAHSGISLTADERHALVNIVRSTDQSVWYSDLVRKTSIRVGPDRTTSFSPVSTRDGSIFVFTNIRGTNSELVRRSASAAETEVLRSDVAPLLALDLTPDDRYLLFAEWKKMNNPNLWALPFSKGGRSAGEPIPVANSAHGEPTGQFSPDGRFVVYVSDETARDEIYVQSFPHAGPRTRISTAGGRYPRWRSPGEILYLGLDGTLFAIGVQATAGGVVAGAPRSLFPLRRLGFGTSHAYDVTRDGRRILALQPLARSGEEAFTIRQNWQPKR